MERQEGVGERKKMRGCEGGQRTVQGNILVLLADTKTYSLLPTKAPPQISNSIPRA